MFDNSYQDKTLEMKTNSISNEVQRDDSRFTENYVSSPNIREYAYESHHTEHNFTGHRINELQSHDLNADN